MKATVEVISDPKLVEEAISEQYDAARLAVVLGLIEEIRKLWKKAGYGTATVQVIVRHIESVCDYYTARVIDGRYIQYKRNPKRVRPSVGDYVAQQYVAHGNDPALVKAKLVSCAYRLLVDKT